MLPDFNDLDTESITNIIPVQQIVKFPTRYDSCLDLIFTNIAQYVESGCVSLPPILTNDHCAISGWMDGFITIIDKNLSRNTLLILTRKKNMEKSDLCCIKSFLE